MKDVLKRARVRLDQVIEKGEATLATKQVGDTGVYLKDEAGYTHFRMTAKSVLQKLDPDGRFEGEFNFIDGSSKRSAYRLPDQLGVLRALRDDLDDGAADDDDSGPQGESSDDLVLEPRAAPLADDTPLVFISCGQFTPEEIRLGKQIAKLVKEQTGATGYFAQNQTSLDALTDHIFKALDTAAGFIAVMHKRGQVTDLKGEVDRTRASVWVEQEIAIASFIQKTRNANLKVQAYIEEGITLEGAREKLMLNPMVFRTNLQVTKHLKKILQTWNLVPAVAERVAGRG